MKDNYCLERDFTSKFFDENDYTVLSNLLAPLLTNFKSIKDYNWDRVYEKCTGIILEIYYNNFENKFQNKLFSEDEKMLLINIFKLYQRIQIYFDKKVDCSAGNLYLRFALSFDKNVSFEALKLITISDSTFDFLDDNKELVEAILKIVNLPDLQLKDNSYKESWEINKTNSVVCDNALEYFNANRNDKNISDLYVEANRIMCNDEELLLRKAYFILALEAYPEGVEEVFKNVIKTLEKDNLRDLTEEFYFLIDVFLGYIMNFGIDFKTFVPNDYIIERLNYDEKSGFERVIALRNIRDHDFKVKFNLTSKKSNLELDNMYFSAVLKNIKRSTEPIGTCIDLEEFKKLLEDFDTLHKTKERNVYKIIFEIIKDVYDKCATHLEPFEKSKCLEKCIKLANEEPLCINWINHFMKKDPHSIKSFINAGVLNIFDNFKSSKEINNEFFNLYETLSIDPETKAKFKKEKLLTKLLESILLTQNSKLYKNDFSDFIKKNKDCYNEYSEFIISTLKNSKASVALIQYISEDYKHEASAIFLTFDIILEMIDNNIRHNPNRNDKAWQKAFRKCYKLKMYFDYDITVYIITLLMGKLKRLEVVEQNFELMEVYLILICHTFQKLRLQYAKNANEVNLLPIYYDLISLLSSIGKVDDVPEIDILEDRESMLEDKKKLMWIEIRFILKNI